MEEIKNENLENQEEIQEVVEAYAEEVTEDSYGAISEELNIPEYETPIEESIIKKSKLPKVMSIVLLVAAILNFVVGGFFAVTDFVGQMNEVKSYDEMLIDSLKQQAEAYNVSVEELTGGMSLEQAIEQYKAQDGYDKARVEYELEQEKTIIKPAIKGVIKDTVNVLVYTSVILGIFALLKCFAIYFKDEEELEEMFAFGCDCDDECDCGCGCDEE